MILLVIILGFGVGFILDISIANATPNINISVYDENSLSSISAYNLGITNNTNSNIIYVGKSPVWNFLDDDLNTYEIVVDDIGDYPANGYTFNYTYGIGHNLANFSITYSFSGSVAGAGFDIQVQNPITLTWTTLYTKEGQSTAKTTDYFTLDNSAGTYGNYPAFRLKYNTTSAGNVVAYVYEIAMITPYSFTKNGDLYISNDSTIAVPTGNDTLLFASNNYINRNYYPTVNDSLDMDAYLLQSGIGSYITTFIYSSSQSNGVSGAMTKAFKLINNTYIDVSEVKTDSQGKGYLYLYPFTMYYIQATYGNQSSDMVNYYPNSNYVLYIQLGGGIVAEIEQVNITSYSNYYWYFHPQGGTYNDTDLIPINFSYTDSDTMTSIFGFNIIYNGSVIDRENISANNGTIDGVTLDTSGKLGMIEIDAYAIRSYSNIFMSYYFTIGAYNQSETFGFDALKNDISSSGIGHPYTDIMGFIIIAVSIAFLSRLPFHIQGAGIFGYVILGLMIYIGFIQISPNPFFNWGSYIGIGILLVSILYLKGGW